MIPWRRAWQPTPVFLPGESLWGHKESDTPEWLGTHTLGRDRKQKPACQSCPFPSLLVALPLCNLSAALTLCMKCGHSSYLCSEYCKCNSEIKGVMDTKNTLTMKQLYADANWHHYHAFIITISQASPTDWAWTCSKKAGAHFWKMTLTWYLGKVWLMLLLNGQCEQSNIFLVDGVYQFMFACWLILCDIFPSAILLLKQLNKMTTAK